MAIRIDKCARSDGPLHPVVELAGHELVHVGLVVQQIPGLWHRLESWDLGDLQL